MTEPPAAASPSDTASPRGLRGRWGQSLRHVRTIVLLAFWLSLLFFPDAPSAHGVLVTLSTAAAGLSALLLVGDRKSVGAAEARQVVRAIWPYLAWLVMLTITWFAHFDDASTQESLRQLCFLVTVFAVAEGAGGNTARWVAAGIIGLALIVVQILGPHSVIDQLGRPLHYRSIQQWSGYPEIGVLATLGAVASLALALADRRWRVRLAGLLLAGGFVAATLFLLSRFSLITIAVTSAWLALVAAIAVRSRLAMTLLAAGVLVTGGLVVMREDLSARLQAVFLDRTAAVGIRSEGWRVARQMMHDHPLLGVGPGHFRAESVQYADPGDVLPHAYNIVLHEGAEVGYLGLAAYLAMWGWVLWRTLRAVGRSVEGVAALATHGMLVAFLVRSQSEHFLANLDASFRVLLLLAFLFGLAESLGRASRARPPLRLRY